MNRQILLVFVALAMMSQTVEASDPFIVQQGAGNELVSSIPGQSVWMPSGGPWNQLGFNWYGDNLRPVAFGTMVILDQEYTGEPQQLGASTPGFLGRATPDVNGEGYQIPAGITLAPSRNYFFYLDSPSAVPLLRSTTDPHAMGVAYEARSPFVELPGTDWAFALLGEVVPEPAGAALCLCWLVLFSAAYHRMR